MDEPTRSTQPSLIMAPPGLEVDPDGETEDAVVNNGIMSPARMRSGSSRSASGQRDGGANGEAPSGDAATAAKDATDTGSGTAAPLPADTIGKPKAGAADRAVKADKAEKPAETVVPQSPAAASSLTPSFTPSMSGSSSAPAAPAAPAAATAASSAGAKPAAAPSSTARADHAPAPSYSRPDWPAGARSATAAPAQPAGPGTSSPSQAPFGAGYSSSNGSSPSATSAVTGAVTEAAAGLANSVASAWKRRGSNGKQAGTRGPQVRRPAKRQAMLTLSRVEPWSVMKFSFVASVVAFVILFVAVAVLYMILASLGVFDSLQHTVSSITSSQSDSGTNISHWFSASLILGYTAMLGALNIVLITAMSTVGSVIYNLIAKTIGGIEVTLRETE